MEGTERMGFVKNKEKTMYVISSRTKNFENLEAEDSVFQKVEEFKYLVSVIYSGSKIQRDIDYSSI